MKSTIKWLMSILAACCVINAPAQDLGPTQFVSAGADVVKLVDESRYGELWDGASPAMQKLVPKAQFNAGLARVRQPLGAQSARAWAFVSRTQMGADQGAPAGEYLNVEYETRFSKGEIKHELISFRLDEDKVWRFAGYVMH